MAIDEAGSTDRSSLIPTVARVLLAFIRIVNGVLGLFFPGTLARLLGASEASTGLVYALRLFGVRTILIGLELLSPDRAIRDKALRPAVVIHGADVAAAVLAGAAGQLPLRAATRAALISTLNTVLAFLASRGR